jgi:hypothetical protein
MLRKTIIVLATAAALTGGLTADAVALATAHTGWDGLGAVGHAIATTPSNVIKLHRARPANSPGRFGGVKRAPRGNSMGQMGQRVRHG